MNMNNKFYLLITFQRSFDHYHLNNKIIHLISSVFYTQNFNIDHFNKFRDTQYIISILELNSKEYKISVIEHTNNLIEFKIPLNFFISLYKQKEYTKDKDNSFENFEGLIKHIIGSHNLTEYNKDVKNILNNVLFVFENLD